MTKEGYIQSKFSSFGLKIKFILSLISRKDVCYNLSLFPGNVLILFRISFLRMKILKKKIKIATKIEIEKKKKFYTFSRSILE